MITNSLDVTTAAAGARGAEGEPVISVRGLRKAYGPKEAVRGIDLEVRRGEIFAFLGPNGAGKTTTVEILEGFRPATAGEVRVLGEDPAHAPRAWRERLGIVLQESHPEADLTVRECAELYAGYYTDPRPVDEVLGLVGLSEHADERAGRLSGGQRRRLEVGLALVGDPELIFLDEPTTGFDPSARRSAWNVIDGLRALGKTIFLTTHYMEEAERLADRIAVLRDGRIVAQGTPATLGDRNRAAGSIVFTPPPGVDPEDLPAGLRERTTADGRGHLLVATEHPVADLHELTGWALALDHELADLEVRRPSLEDVYLALTSDTEGSAVR
jgi:ABC-2 type transport system ATP-binding protein